MSRIDELRDDDAELPLYLALGVLSALQHLDPWLPASAPAAPTQPPPGPLDPASERLLYLALGLVSFRQELTAALTSLLPPPSSEAAAGPAPTPRELLR